MPVNYANGKIYRLVSDCTNQVYIGSTVKSLTRRFTKHKCAYRQFLNETLPYYFRAFDLLKHPDCTIELIEDFPCQSKAELIAREAHHIRTTPNVVNLVIPDRTVHEYYMDNRERISGVKKEYYQRNKTRIKERMKAYYQKKKLATQSQQQNVPNIVENAVPTPLVTFL